jgi:hypothetical protein
MNLLRRLFRTFDRRRGVRARPGNRPRYAVEVLHAGWVDLPKAFREARIRRP